MTALECRVDLTPSVFSSDKQSQRYLFSAMNCSLHMPSNYCCLTLCPVFIALSGEIWRAQLPLERCPLGLIRKTSLCQFCSRVSSSLTSTQSPKAFMIRNTTFFISCMRFLLIPAIDLVARPRNWKLGKEYGTGIWTVSLVLQAPVMHVWFPQLLCPGIKEFELNQIHRFPPGSFVVSLFCYWYPVRPVNSQGTEHQIWNEMDWG